MEQQRQKNYLPNFETGPDLLTGEYFMKIKTGALRNRKLFQN